MIDEQERCKSLLFKVAVKHGVAPRLISERLLSIEDKKDMLKGLVKFEMLDCHVQFWKAYGMCDYVNGSIKPYERHGAYITKG